MQTKLIQTKDYLLLVEEVYGFKVGDWNYEEDNTIPIYQFDYNIDEYPGNKIIAYRRLTENSEELNLPELPNPFEEEPLMKQASKLREFRGYHKDSHYSFCGGFIEGYKAAQSNKQFSLEDVKKAIEMAREYEFVKFGDGETENKYTEEEIIQSLYAQRLPVDFEPEFEYVLCKSCDGAGWMLDCDECRGYGRIETTELRMTTNSDGKKELVGTYKY